MEVKRTVRVDLSNSVCWRSARARDWHKAVRRIHGIVARRTKLLVQRPVDLLDPPDSECDVIDDNGRVDDDGDDDALNARCDDDGVDVVSEPLYLPEWANQGTILVRPVRTDRATMIDGDCDAIPIDNFDMDASRVFECRFDCRPPVQSTWTICYGCLGAPECRTM